MTEMEEEMGSFAHFIIPILLCLQPSLPLSLGAKLKKIVDGVHYPSLSTNRVWVHMHESLKLSLSGIMLCSKL